ncbi:Kelch-like protein 32 [Xenoophorus captivus]|uniref:Kelch-like protein 32 n=1 Tax=Xenoophorus captivus TaxID=1517983 RepID=A0ABV0SH93_9TELE
MPSEPSLSKEMLTGQRLCHSKSHQDSVLSALNQQRKDGQLCDVTLVAGEQKFHAHKAVLAACSDYFRVGTFHVHCFLGSLTQQTIRFKTLQK